MYGRFFLSLCVTILFCGSPSVNDVSRQADDCTSGFMSMDRMEAPVKGSFRSTDHVLGDVLLSTSSINRQAILPYINFTCDGSILSWTFGAQWEGNSPRYTELQIWRSSEDGSYTKVGSTTIMLEEESSTKLYQYTLTSPLPFQAGDILGYFQGSQPTSQFRLLFEDVGSDHPLYYSIQNSPSSQFVIGSSTETLDRYHLLIGVQTNPAGCDCGFMSLERMNILLGLDTVGNRVFTEQRQQITPDISFTCNGLITKWILGANWNNSNQLYPELQVWRSVGNDEYHKINGTFISLASRSKRINEYDNFSPIPVLAGDILGVFIPKTDDSKLRLWSEKDNGPVVYYVGTGSATESPVDTIDLQKMLPLSSTSYLPLVTVEIATSSPTSTVSQLIITTSLTSASTVNDKSSTFLYPKPVATAPLSATQLISTVAASKTLPPHTTEEDSAAIDDVALLLGVGVAGTLLVVITATVIIITVLVYIRKKTSKLNVTDNVVYQSSTSEVELFPNVYTATGDHSPTPQDQEYMYATVHATTASQQATSIEATNLPNTTDEASSISTSTNVAYGIPTFTNPSYVTTIATSTNHAYQSAQDQRKCDTYDYVN